MEAKWETVLAALIIALGLTVAFYVRGLVSSRKSLQRANQEILEQQQLLRAVVDYSPEFIALKSASDLKYVLINKAGSDILGFSQAEIEQHSIDDLTDEVLASKLLEADKQCLKNGIPLHLPRVDWTMRDGKKRIYRVNKTPIFDSTGEAKYILTISADITEVERAREMLALHNQGLRDLVEQSSSDLSRAQQEILERLERVAAVRDDFTGAHIGRLGRLCEAIALQLGLSKEDCELITRASPLHDLGKVAIPDSILLKPGRLEPGEWEVMKTHTTVGAQLLSGGTTPLIRMAEVIALTHHEKWDGTGYPLGLRGASIPLVGRIVAVADVFDALTSERPYKPAWSVEAAINEVRALSGIHFDPAVVEAFISAVPQFSVAYSQPLT